ncbi:MFS transporter [Frigoribacterium sp. 2-23]|uniref:MFS transporter n=1 Tax=Frigoribacterium sp. 2-23 TaxID=3415006 RepID=UPI003C703867
MTSAGPLTSAPFRWLLAARTSSILGNAVAPIALAFAVLDLTGSAADLGLVVAARSLANVAVLLFGGVLADRMRRDVVLVGTSLAAAATQGIVAGLVLSGQATVPTLVVLSVLNGGVAALSLPAAAALVPQTVPATQLRPANALLRLSLNASGIVGAAGGAGLVAAVGPGWGLAVDAAGFAVAGGLYALVRLPRSSAAGLEGATRASSVWRDLGEGWQEFSSRRWLWVVVAQFAVLNAAFVGATTVLGPVVADGSFGRAVWGLVVAAQTVGLAAGAVVALRWRPRRALAVGVALMAVTAVPVAALGLAPLVPVLIAAFFAGGVALEIFAISWDQSVQTHVPADRLARVYSFDMVGSFVAIPVGEVVVGPVAEAVGVAPTLLGCAVLIVLATAAALTVPEVRRLSVADPRNDVSRTVDVRDEHPPDATHR